MKKIITTAVQIFVTTLLLLWIFHDEGKRQKMLHALQSAEFIWLIPGVLCVGILLLIQTVRWHVLLSIQGIRLGWWRTLRLNMIGAFFNLFLLGSTGGDVVKIFYLLRETPNKKSSAFLSVVVDRVIGTLGLALVALVVSISRINLLYSHEDTRHLLGILIAILGSVIATIIIAFTIERLGWIERLPKWMPLRKHIVELGTAFSLYAQEGGPVLCALGISGLGHFFLFSSYFFASLAFQSQLSLLDIFSVLPIVLTIASLPISLSGLGVREGLLQTTLNTLYGTSPAVAVLISFTSFLLMMFWSLVGGVVYLFYRPSGPQNLHINDMAEEIHNMEDRIGHSS